MSNRILGIDPGLVKTGWGVVDMSGNSFKYVSSGAIKTNSKDNIGKRLVHLYDCINDVIKEYNPNFAAIEEVFVNANPETSKKLIMARAAAILSIAKNGLLVCEYSANQIKKNTTGRGHASKEEVYRLVQMILNVNIDIDGYDEVDALAVSICHGFSLSF